MKEKLNIKRILLITIGLSLFGTIPKLIKSQIIDWNVLQLYFVYIGLCILLFFSINRFVLWVFKASLSSWIKFSIGLVCGFALLIFIHFLLFYLKPNVIIYFLNLKVVDSLSIFKITAFRAFVIHSITFAFLIFFKNKDERVAFQQEIEHLNQHLQKLKTVKNVNKEYKNSLITRFQDKLIPIDVSKIAFFHLSNGIVNQYLFSGQKYVQNVTLENLENDLNPNIFFRANRQFLLNKKAIEKVEQIENRKLKVLLTLTLPEDIIISKAKSSAFIKWLEIQ